MTVPPPDDPPVRSGWRRINPAWLLFGFFFSVYALFSPGALHNPDSGTRMLTAISLARRGSIEITDRDFPGVRLDSLEFGRNRHGHWVEMFNEGQSVLLAPWLAPLVYLADSHHVAVKKPAEFVTSTLVFPALSALVPVVLWWLLGLFAGGTRDRLLACMVLGLATPAVVYASNGQHEMQMAALVMGAFGAQILYLRTARKGWLVLDGALLGLVVFFRYSSAPLAVVFALALALALWRQGRGARRILADLAILTAVSLAVYAPQLYFNFVKTGSPFALPTSLWNRDASWIMSLPRAEGLAIMLFSPGESVFYYHPILLVSLALLPWVGRALLREGWTPPYVYAALLFAMVSGWIAWRAEISWGPRTLIHLGFLMVLPAWSALRQDSPRWAAPAVWTALVLGMVVNFLGTLYPAELDFGAQRVAPVYGRAAAPAWVDYPRWRAADFLHTIRGEGVHTPERFARLADSRAYLTPQWWWIRLWKRPDYGVPGFAIVCGTAGLAILAALFGFGLAVVGREAWPE